jgi:dihydrofolate reductase
MKSTIIVAYDKHYGIGIDGKLPWKSPEDLTLFKHRTMSQAVVMGSKTYDSLPKKNQPLPGRTNIILTRHAPPFRPEDCLGKSLVFVSSPDNALQVAATQNLHPYVCGGEQIYKLFLNRGLVDEVYASEVIGEFDCDTWFPIKLIDKFSGWDREILGRYERFNLVRYITITKMREDLDAARKKIESLRASLRMKEERLDAYKRQAARNHRDQVDYLEYDDDDRR